MISKIDLIINNSKTIKEAELKYCPHFHNDENYARCCIPLNCSQWLWTDLDKTQGLCGLSCPGLGGTRMEDKGPFYRDLEDAREDYPGITWYSLKGHYDTETGWWYEVIAQYNQLMEKLNNE